MTKLFSFDQLEAVQLTDRPDTVTLETDMWTGVRAIPAGYQHGFDNPATYQRAASYELITSHRPLMVGVNRVTFAGFIYSKGAIGTRVGRHQWRVTVNGRVSTLTLEATEKRAEFEENCRRVIAFAETLAIENGQTSDWHIHGAWGRTGVVARARLTGFAELVVSTPEATFTVQSQAVGAAVARNGFGSYVAYTGYSEYSPVGSPIEQSSLNDSLSKLFDATETQPWAAQDPVVCVRRMDKCYTLIHQDLDQKENETMPKGGETMPWLSIIMALLTFFTTKKSGASNTTAALAAGLVGAGTYYTTHETEWGKTNLGALDGVNLNAGVKPPTTVPVADNATGSGVVLPSDKSGSSTGVFDVLKTWGATGTATVIGAGAAATGSGVFDNKYVVWGVIGLAALFILK